MAVGKQQIVDALNEALGLELSAITQYMWHHVMAKGMESPALMEEFRSAAMAEMRHAESIAERIDYLGGTPTKQPAEIKMGGDSRKMVQDDLASEMMAIEKYRSFIRMAFEANDSTTRLMLEEILSQEEEHAHTWETVLGK